MVMTQCLHCKNSNPQCRESFVIYYESLNCITQLVNDGNRDSRFFKKDFSVREYGFDIKCSKYEEVEKNAE